MTYKRYIITFLFSFFIIAFAFADNKKSKFKHNRKSTFHNDSFHTRGKKGGNGNTKGGLPEDPGGGGSSGGGGGNPIPISGGSLLLVGGLVSYTLLRKKYNKDA